MTPNVHSLTAVMEACNTGQQQALTLSLLKQMRQQGFQPTAPVYTAAIKACASTLPAAQWELALALLNEMQHSSRAAPSAHAYSCALRACSRASQWQHALAILSDMQSAGNSPTPRCLAYVTVACVQSKQQQEVQALVDKLTATESSSFDAFTYRALISAHSYLKQYQQCVDAQHCCVHRGTRSTPQLSKLLCMLTASCSSGRPCLR
jgi:pentatricopeptide repeat protein